MRTEGRAWIRVLPGWDSEHEVPMVDATRSGKGEYGHSKYGLVRRLDLDLPEFDYWPALLHRLKRRAIWAGILAWLMMAGLVAALLYAPPAKAGENLGTLVIFVVFITVIWLGTASAWGDYRAARALHKKVSA